MIVRHPTTNEVMGQVEQDGKVLNSNHQLDLIISQIKRGKASKLALQITVDDGRGESFLLVNLIQASKKRRGIDWKNEKPLIQKLDRENIPLRKIADIIGVSPAALSAANKKFNLYVPKDGGLVTKKQAERKKRGLRGQIPTELDGYTAHKTAYEKLLDQRNSNLLGALN